MYTTPQMSLTIVTNEIEVKVKAPSPSIIYMLSHSTCSWEFQTLVPEK